MSQKKWFISDLHFFHYNIIKYTNRPFKDVNEMNRVLIENWNTSIAPKDIVYIVGDFSFGDPEKTKNIVSKLNGYKILIRGNHDKGPDKMKVLGFNEVYEHYMLDIAGERVLLHHYPYRPVVNNNIPSYDLKKLNRRPIDKGLWLIHGHVHQHWKQKAKMINMSVEVWDYKPVSWETIEQLINNGPKNIPEIISSEDSLKDSY